ncbi:MAG: hypothetical protein QXL67_04115 [Candidatus Bathyarchaeia archaeon]
MIEKRVINRKVAEALGVICIISLILIIINAYTLSDRISELNSEVKTLRDENSSLNSKITERDNLLASLNSQLSEKNSQIQTLTSQMDQLQAWLDGNVTDLQRQIRESEQQSVQFQQRIMRLQASINSLIAPKLVKVDLKAEDIRPLFGTPHLHVYGYVCNVGNYTALNSTIHVTAFQSGGVTAIDTSIDLGSIDGESWRSVDSNIYYNGSELVNFTLTLEWTSPPMPC